MQQEVCWPSGPRTAAALAGAEPIKKLHYTARFEEILIPPGTRATTCTSALRRASVRKTQYAFAFFFSVRHSATANVVRATLNGYVGGCLLRSCSLLPQVQSYKLVQCNN